MSVNSDFKGPYAWTDCIGLLEAEIAHLVINDANITDRKLIQ